MQTDNSDNTRITAYIAGTPEDAGAAYGKTKAGTWSTGWHLVSFVFNGSGAQNSDRLKIYIDGRDETDTSSFGGTITTVLMDSTATVRIGDFQNLSRFWNGKIDDVRIFYYPLS